MKKNPSLIESIQEFFKNKNVEFKLAKTEKGPSATLFKFKLLNAILVDDIKSYEKELSEYLNGNNVRIEAPILGTSYIGITAQNEKQEFFYVEDLIKESKAKEKDLVIPIGKTIGNKIIYIDFFDNTHLAISGSSGSGKSNFLVYLINVLTKRFSPEELKLVLADPKLVEFSIFKDSPYLMRPVIHKTTEALSSIKELLAEMEVRYQILEDTKNINIFSYNKTSKNKMPFIFFIADEISDFRLSGKDNESKIIREGLIHLLQMGKAVGINIIIATSRPCEDILPIPLLVNIFNRLAFKMATETNSKFFLDRLGAEKLTGNGEGLFCELDDKNLKIIQTPLFIEDEINL